MNSPHSAKMKFQKTETEYNMKSIRFLLLTITTMFIIVAGLMVVLGLSVYSRYHSFSFLYDSVKSGSFFTPSIMVVLMGMVMLVVTCFGFFGSLRESTCMVNVYAFILFLVLSVELVIVCLAFTMSGSQLKQYIDIPIQQYSTDTEVQAEIDALQTSLHCCGKKSYLDYVGVEFTGNHSTAVASTVVDGDTIAVLLPTSCCVQYGNAICTQVRLTGCQDALVSMVVQNSTVLGVLGVSIMFIQALGIIFALLLAHCIRKLKSERAMMKWKVCEQRILARKAEEDSKLAENTPSVFIEKSTSSIA